MRSLPRQRLLTAALAAAFATAFATLSPSAAAQTAAPAAAQAFDLDIPAQPLAPALNELSRQTGLAVYVGGDVVAGLTHLARHL